MKRWSLLPLLAVVLIFGAHNFSQGQGVDPCTISASGPTPEMAFQLEEDGFDSPVFITHAGDGSGRLFIIEQPGRIRIVKDSFTFPQPFLDIEDRVAVGGERGLMSMAFHPGYANNGRFFVNYTRISDGSTVIAEYQVGDDPDVASRQERVLMVIDQPFQNHNGGQIQFGPDGYLYIGMGDGGGSNDDLKNGQDLSTLHGSLLRIDVDNGDPYGIPADNPFLDTPNARPEAYAYGFRNPWRFSFDRCDGRLFLGDVGQDRIEEIDLVEKGGNYGWNTMEGSQCFEADFCIQGGLELPIFEYFHDAAGGRSVTGGYVYRGRDFPDLVGRYFYADFVSGRIWSLTETGPGNWESQRMLRGRFLSSFGEDEAGELYIASFDGGIFRLVQTEASNALVLGQALDVNQNDVLDDAEIMDAIMLWATGETVPDLNIVIDDASMKTLISVWARGQQLSDRL